MLYLIQLTHYKKKDCESGSAIGSRANTRIGRQNLFTNCATITELRKYNFITPGN